MIASSGLNLKNLTTDGFVAFILAIIFTIACLASFIYYARNKELNKVVSIVITMVLPTIAVFCWMYLILKVNSVALAETFIWSAVSAALYLIISLGIALIIVSTSNENKAVEEKPAEEEKAEEQPAEEEKEDEVLMIDAPAEEEKAEDVVVIENAAEEQPAEEVAEETTEETTEEVEETEEATNEPEGVVFTKASKESFAVQLARLPIETRALYKEILEYAESKEDTKTKESLSHVMVKVGRMRLIEFKFARGNLVCKFMAGSSELKNYSLAEKAVKIKEKPVTIELENEDSVAVAKNMVDIVYKNIVEANKEKKAADVIAPVSDETEENGENE